MEPYEYFGMADKAFIRKACCKNDITVLVFVSENGVLRNLTFLVQKLNTLARR